VGVNGIQFLLFILLLLAAVPLVGRYMAFIFGASSALPVEGRIYALCGIDPSKEMAWWEYAKAVLWFNLVGLLFLFLLQLCQRWLPFNPERFSGVRPDLAFNTAVSFVTNTNWQAYGGETTLSYLTQMAGLTVQNFVSAATGNAVLLALIRGSVREAQATLGNFWVDLTRTVLYLLLPLSLLFSLILVSQGVIQNLHSYVDASTLAGEVQTIPMGPVASQVAIKQLGTNGGGFFAANSAHPFENPTPLSNFLETFAILLIPASATYMYGCFVKSKRQGWVIFAAMFLLWIGGVGIATLSQQAPNRFLGANPVLEGMETRVGSHESLLWAVSTTGTSNGSVACMHSSLSPLAGGVAMFNIMIGEVVFGGIGVGMCGIVMFAILTIFIAGLMVGRTPEYLRKKIEKQEIIWVMIAILTPCALILLGAGVASLLPQSLREVSSPGPHGLSEILYAFSSAAGNNGSAFAGLNANTPFYNWVLGGVMIVGRLAILLSSLAVAGRLVKKSCLAPSIGTLATNSPMFCLLLVCVILIAGALTFFPALSLGPILEQILMLRGQGV
jgi:potassium-transporting ATPase potassium-binding subunit